jgi:hypothetical protein
MKKNRKKGGITSSIISQMIDIKQNPTCRKIRRRICFFKKNDFDSVTAKDISDLINKSFSFPIEIFPQKPVSSGKSIWRARINEDSEHNPYTKTEDISYKKEQKEYGRCNLIGESVFYGADGRSVAATEVCNGKLTKNNPILYLTVGEWKLKEAINVSIICHSKIAHKRSGDLIIAYQSLLSLKKKTAKNKSEIRQWKIINKFLAYEFSKEVHHKEENKYLLSAVYSHSLLKSGNSLGIYYPSVAYQLYGHNVAYSKKIIDESKLVLEKVHYIKCTFVRKKQPPKIEEIACTNNIHNGIITW